MGATAPAASDTLMLHSTDADADACFGLLPDHANTGGVNTRTHKHKTLKNAHKSLFKTLKKKKINKKKSRFTDLFAEQQIQ